VKKNCPVFKTNHCPYTGLKAQLANSQVFDHGCIVKPGQCKTVEEVADVLSSVVPKDEAGKKIMAHAIQQAVLLGYNEEKVLGKSCPVHQTWPFNTGTDGKPVITPQTAIVSICHH
jgi:hypothetical protein